MAIPNPAKAKELLDGKRLRDKERDESRLKLAKEEAAEKKRQLKSAKSLVADAFEAALERERYIRLPENLGNHGLSYLSDLGFRVESVESILVDARQEAESRKATQANELAADLGAYKKLKNDLIYTMCVWVNVRYPGLSKEVAAYIDALLDLGVNFSRASQVKSLLEYWVFDSYEYMNFESLLPNDHPETTRVPVLELNPARIEKLKLLSESCLGEVQSILHKLEGFVPDNSKLLSDIARSGMSPRQKVLTWEACGNFHVKEAGISALLLEWLSSDEGQEFMTEVDLSVKGSARAGLDSVTVDALCCQSKGILNPVDISEVFKILGFKTKINGSTIELGWD